jgi:hypothetical protein
MTKWFVVEPDPDSLTTSNETNTDQDFALREWSQQLYLERYRDNSNSEAIREANELFQQAHELDSQGHTAEALRLCGAFLERNLDGSPRGYMFEPKSFIMRCNLMLILRLLCKPSSLFQMVVPRHYQTFLASQIVPAVDTEAVDISLVLLQICLTIVRFLLGYDQKSFGRRMGIQLLEIVEKRLEFRIDESRLLVKYLAESYVYDSPHKFELRARKYLPPQAEALIHRHLAYLNIYEDLYDKDSLNYFYGIGRVFLLQEMDEEAMGLVRQAFIGRTVCFGEVHKESEIFIDGLIRSLCETRKGKTYNLSGNTRDRSHTIIDDLIGFSLEEERYAEAESLIWECLIPTKDLKRTSANSPNDDFPVLYSKPPKWHGVQSRLACHKTPGGSFFWEDSRMYLCRWAGVTLVPAFPVDPFPRAPVKFVIEGNDFSVVMSQRATRDLQEMHGANISATSLLQGTALWQYTEFMRSEGKLKNMIPRGHRPEFLSECTSMSPTDVRNEAKSESYTLWVFPDEQLEAGPIDDVAVSPVFDSLEII